MLCNVDGVVSTATIRKVIDAISTASITFRKYISTDLTAPAGAAFTSCRLKEDPGRRLL